MRLLGVALLAISVLSTAMPASAQTDVETRLGDLERRVKALETTAQDAQRAPSITRSRWRELARGMSPEQVRALLGEPDRIEASPNSDNWSWDNGGYVSFQRGKLGTWSEPRDQAARASSDIRSREVVRWTDKIRAKIRGNIILPQDIPGNPEAIFDITLLPTGEVLTVRKTKSSGNPRYDDAVERAINKSSPLPLSDDRSVFQRQLQLSFRPQDR